MTYLLATYWLPLLIALAVGGVTGWMTYDRAARGGWPRWLLVLGLAFVVGLVVAGFAWLPRGWGFWLETALLFLLAWFIGCLLGNWLAGRRAAPAEPVGVAPPVVAPVAAPEPAPELAPVAAVVEPEPVPEPDPIPVAAAQPEPLPEPVPEPIPVAEPEPAPIPEPPVEPPAVEPPAVEPPPVELPAEPLPGARPAAAVLSGAADDLQRIKGIGPKNERLLHGLGIYYFRQIAGWSDENIAWVNGYLSFKGRIERENWVGQAKDFADQTP